LKRKAEPKKEKRSRFAFIRDIISELKKVTWPSRQATIYLTIIVVAVCVVAGAILWAFDYGFSELINRFLLR
jgi:preprotein translocase subunit SecE